MSGNDRYLSGYTICTAKILALDLNQCHLDLLQSYGMGSNYKLHCEKIGPNRIHKDMHPGP